MFKLTPSARRIYSVAFLITVTVIGLGLSTLVRKTSALTNGGSITALGVPLTENFDTLPASGSATWTNNSTIPGWYHARTGTGTTIVANDGSSNAGNLYSYGTGTNTDRALGSLGSGNAAVGNLFWGVRLQNNTGSTITSLDVSYTGEQWRNSAAAAQAITFSYLVGSPTVTGSLAEFQSAGVPVTNLDFTSPITGGTAGALNGNSAANRVSRSFTITGLNIPNGTEIMLRWSDPDHTGTDHGLAIDDFSVTAMGSGGPTTTSPTGVGAASPNSVVAGGNTLLTVTTTAGTNPTSTGLTVTADLSSIGGSATQTFYDNGTNGDVTAGDNVFSFQSTVAGGTSAGAKSLPATIADAQSRTGSASIALTVTSASTPLSGMGSANPSTVQAGETTGLAVEVTPATNPASTGIAVTADLSSIGGSANQSFSGVGNTFTFNATVAANTTSGMKSLPVTITDAQSHTYNTNIVLSVQALTPVNHVVISQVYGGGGNANATYTNDFVELYNPTSATVNLTGWSLQYGAATGSTWTNKQPIGGIIGPSEYYLVSLASGGSVGAPMPFTPNISGDINMSATAGKIALVSNGDPLSGACPLGSDLDIVDFVGYGTTANCNEGTAKAPAPSNTTALFRKANGLTDTDQNGSDFITGTPNPRRTAPIVELGPWVASTDPITGATTVPYDATITVDFSEPVTVDDGWYSLTCSVSGQHTSATVAPYNGSKGYQITPNVSFQFGEQCTVTIAKEKVHDQDTDDSAPDTDTLFQSYTWSFTVVGAGQAAPYPPSVHLTMGNPSNATPDLSDPNNYLMEKPTYALSYNRDKGTPNWVSWHLDTSWFGNLTRVDTFRADPRVPPDWYRVQATDYFTSGFDRGHMTPNADRDNENRIPINQETYLMSNMVPQAPDNNQGPWAEFENYLRSILTDNGGQEIYIVSGPYGVGGSGSNGGTTNTIANGHVTVPSYTWKVALVLPKGDDDISRTTCSARTIAILMPNTQGIRNKPWQDYLTTVDAIETLTGYDLFSNLPAAVQNCVEAGSNGTNPPGTANQFANTAEDTPVTITLQAVRPNTNNLTFSVVGNGPTQGMLGSISAATCTDGTCTATVLYTPGQDYNGADSFLFKVNNGTADSNQSTVSLTISEVNDTPVATNDNKTTSHNTMLSFPATDLTGNDSAGSANETNQTLTVTSVSTTANTHGSVSLSNGTVTYSPAANFSGAASFTYQVCDNGTTNGASDSKCASASVNVMVACPVLDLTPITLSQGTYGTSYPSTTLTPTAGAGPYLFNVTGLPTGLMANTTSTQVTISGTPTQSGTFNVLVTVADGYSCNNGMGRSYSLTINKATPVLTWSNPVAIAAGTPLSSTQLNATANVPGTFAYMPPAGTVLSAGNGQLLSVSFTPTDTANYTGATKTVQINVLNGCGITVNPLTLPQATVGMPFVQTLSASPTGSYSFSVFEGNLPPGLQIVNVLGIYSLRGTPTASGNYKFTIKAAKNNTTCEGARGYTLNIP